MTKTLLVKWLEGKQNQAFSASWDKYELELSQLTDNICAKLELDAAAEKIEALLTEACDTWYKWKTEHEGIEVKITDGYYGSFTRQIYDYVSQKGAARKEILRQMVSFETDKIETLKKSYCDLRENINQTYDNVICAVKASKNAKEASAYLTGLGFDLSELEAAEIPVTALTVQINPKFLFFGEQDAA